MKNNCKHLGKPLDNGKPWCKKASMVCPMKPHACEWYEKKEK
ncbi:hypothetical protein V7114_06810 [Neobacillus niacini]